MATHGRRAMAWRLLVVLAGIGAGPGLPGALRGPFLAVPEVRAEAPPPGKDARRRWALQRMDEVAAERRRCGERFRKPADVRACEAAHDRRHRAYDQIYLDAAR